MDAAIKAAAAVLGAPKKYTRSSYKRSLAATPSTSPGKLDPERGNNPDGELGRDNDETLDRNNDGELSRSYDGKCTRKHDGEASEESALSLKKQNRFLHRELKTVVAEGDEYRVLIAKLDKGLRKERSENATAEREMQQEISSLKERNAHLDSEVKKVQGKLDSSLVDLRRAQLNSFKQAQTGWFVQEDSEIHHALTQLYKDVRSWAKTYGIKSLEAFRDFPSEQSAYIGKFVTQVAAFESNDEFFGFKYPFLILAALVSDVLRKCIFENYFYMFPDPDNPSDHGVRANILGDTFSRICSTNAVDARTWRALLFRAVFPQPESSEMRIRKELSVANPTTFRNRLVDEICHGHVSAFLRQMEQDEKQRCNAVLQELIDRAMKLFSRLQTQRADYVWHKPSDTRRISFDVHSPKVAADRLVKLEDEDGESQNGKKIKLVVSPAVQKFGDSNGENFQTGRFLAKAVVFLEG